MCATNLTLHDLFHRSTIDSNAQSNVTQGRVLCRLVSMFESVDELVEESDRRHALEADAELDDELPEPTPEYRLPLLTVL